jgi:FlaA1/EpsC-like NDP-sugar epimerase
MLERYENSLHAIRMELEDGARRSASVGRSSATSPTRARCASDAGAPPEIVFHAAAHKHVPLMEENPCEAVKNNVRGTRLLAEAAEAAGVDRFILISTDKAVNPTSVMGASKRLAELVVRPGDRQRHVVRRRPVRQRARQQRQRGAAVLEQIKRGGPVTITHPRSAGSSC